MEQLTNSQKAIAIFCIIAACFAFISSGFAIHAGQYYGGTYGTVYLVSGTVSLLLMFIQAVLLIVILDRDRKSRAKPKEVEKPKEVPKEVEMTEVKKKEPISDASIFG